MVNTIVRRLSPLLFICLYISLILTPVLASTEIEQRAVLKVVTDKTETEMGKSLSVQLVYYGQNIPEPAQLYSWKKDFYIEDMSRDSEHLPGGYIKTTQYLRLYPKTTGVKTLHAIVQGGAIARPVDINIRPLIRNNINGAPHWKTPPKAIWQGETITVSIVQNLMSENNQIKTEEARFTGFSVLHSWQESQYINGIKTVQLNWQLKAQNYGHFSLEAPSVVQRGSRGRWRFYLPAIKIIVKPVPAYIPATVPVAKAEVSSKLERLNNQPFWQLSIKTRGYQAEEIYGIRSRLAKMAHTTPERVKFTANELLTNTGKQSVQSWRVAVPTWTIPLKNTHLSIDYFDPELGQLKQVQVQLPSVWYFPVLAQYLLFILLLLIISMSGFYLHKWFRSRQKRIAFIRAIETSNSAEQLRQLLLQTSGSRTLSEWAEPVQKKNVKDLAQSLNLLCFKASNTKTENDLLNAIKSQLIDYYSHKA